MSLTPPPISYDENMYSYIKSIKKDVLEYACCNLEVLGKGASGTTFVANVKPIEKFPLQIVLKEQKITRHSTNEFYALKYLRDRMVARDISGYFIFMYGSFISGKKRYFILEKADMLLDDYFLKYRPEPVRYLSIFYHIAQAVSLLEAVEFNHGDLWSENVLISWETGSGEDVPEKDRPFTIKIIDFDCAYKADANVKNPSYGGADKIRKKFILGYDLNRYFDSLLYSFDDYREKKLENKKRKINKLKRQRKQGKKVVVPSIEDSDDSDREFDTENIVYPPEILTFIAELTPAEPNDFTQCPGMSGKTVMEEILDYAKTIGIELK